MLKKVEPPYVDVIPEFYNVSTSGLRLSLYEPLLARWWWLFYWCMQKLRLGGLQCRRYSYRVFKKKLSVYTTSFTIFYVIVLLTQETWNIILVLSQSIWSCYNYFMIITLLSEGENLSSFWLFENSSYHNSWFSKYHYIFFYETLQYIHRCIPVVG